MCTTQHNATIQNTTKKNRRLSLAKQQRCIMCTRWSSCDEGDDEWSEVNFLLQISSELVSLHIMVPITTPSLLPENIAKNNSASFLYLSVSLYFSIFSLFSVIYTWIVIVAYAHVVGSGAVQSIAAACKKYIVYCLTLCITLFHIAV